MSAAENHLMSTPIVDKNGVLTSRRKNLSATNQNLAKKTPSLPPVSIAAPSNHEEKKLHRLLYGEYGGTMNLPYLELLKQEDPETITIATRLLSSGTETAQIRVRRSLDSALSKMAVQHFAKGENWRESSTYGKSPYIKHEMLAGWHIGTILEESGRNDTSHDGELEEWAMSSHSTLDGRVSENLDDTHWRGLAILAVSCTAAKSQELYGTPQYLPEFISWAAQQDDAEAVISVVEQSQTFHVPTLRDLMRAYMETAPSLRDGVL